MAPAFTAELLRHLAPTVRLLICSRPGLALEAADAVLLAAACPKLEVLHARGMRVSAVQVVGAIVE